MREILLLLAGICFGAIIGIGIMLWLMGPKLRDQYMGRNQENKPIVIEWLDGHTKDFNIMMHGALVFTGVIHQMTLHHDSMSVEQRIDLQIVEKLEMTHAYRQSG